MDHLADTSRRHYLRLRRVVVGVVGGAALASLSACAADDPDTTTGTTVSALPVVEPPDLRAPVALSDDLHGLSATLQQYREDEVANRIAVKVTSAADTPIEVITLRLDWPGLEPGAAEPIDYTLFPRTRVDLRVPLTAAICSDPPQVDETLPDAPIAAVAQTDLGEIVFPVTDPEGVLGRIHPRECRRQAVEQAASFELAGWTDVSAAPPTMAATLTLTPGSSGVPVTVEAVHGSVLVNVAAEGLPVTLAPGGDRVEIPITATNNRCDSHALGESKKPYLFQVDLLVGDEPVSYVVEPSTATAEALSTGIVGRCPPDDGSD